MKNCPNQCTFLFLTYQNLETTFELNVPVNFAETKKVQFPHDLYKQVNMNTSSYGYVYLPIIYCRTEIFVKD